MKKWVLITILIINMFTLQSCKANSNQQSTDFQTSNQSSQQIKITESQALDIVKTKLGSAANDLLFDVKLASDKNFWWIISYHNYNQEGTGGIQATYYVEVNSGKLFEAFINNFDNLIPLDKITFVDESSSEYANSSEYSTKLLIKSLGLKDTDPTSYNGLIKRDNNFYFLMNALPSDSDLGIWEFYMIDKNTNEVYKWDVKNDVIILIE